MLDDVERPLSRAALRDVDDKVRILAAMKNVWGDRLTTVFRAPGTLRTGRRIGREVSPG